MHSPGTSPRKKICPEAGERVVESPPVATSPRINGLLENRLATMIESVATLIDCKRNRHEGVATVANHAGSLAKKGIGRRRRLRGLHDQCCGRASNTTESALSVFRRCDMKVSSELAPKVALIVVADLSHNLLDTQERGC